ncbi:MAG TPA: fumarylacetoacetate hydrolase family protein [Planctomycetota bacterium]|jgi:2-keto-4-pentenoate hydratase/2-oxohepta-3-ene-1,7-dioic acid hydratase in catechol pathway
MRLVSFGPIGQERLGALIHDGRQIVDLNAADPAIPSTMLAFLNGNFWERTRRICADTSSLQGKAVVEAPHVRLGAPVPRPGQIICVGLNYKDHADEQGVPYPKAPLLFGKSPSAAGGPNDDVVYPADVSQLDYEVELGVIIGRKIGPRTAETGGRGDGGTGGSADAAQSAIRNPQSAIAGYCVFNDVSARCCQYGDKQWFRGKSFDTFAPFGPALVTPDEVPDPQNLALTTKVNGEVRQSSNTGQMIHRVEQILAHITRGLTLLPGDVIATGTPSGVGVFFKPPRLLKRGDVVELEVQGLGKLVNRIV